MTRPVHNLRRYGFARGEISASKSSPFTAFPVSACEPPLYLFQPSFLSSFPDFWPSRLGEGTRGKQPPRIITLVSDAEIPQLPSLHGDSPWLLIVSRSTCQRLSLLFFLSLLLFSIFFQLRAGYRACLLTFSITNVNALYHWRKMIDEADKFSRMIYTMTLCFDGEKKGRKKLN